MNRRLEEQAGQTERRGMGRTRATRCTGLRAATVGAALLALLLQGCGLLSSSPSTPSSAEPSPAAAPPSDAARASGKAPLLVSARTGREAALAIEQAMDPSDIVKLGSVLIVAGSTVPQSWRNPKSGREFTVTPMRGFAGDQGACREFSVDVNAEGRIDRMTGAACQGSDQRWRVLH